MNEIKAQATQTFKDGTLHVAHITFTNLKNQAITYTARLYFALPSDIYVPITWSEEKTFIIPAGGSMTIDFPIVTPLLSPATPSVTFCVCCAVGIVGAGNIAFFVSADVVVNFTPAVEWGDIIWDSSLLDCDKDELYQYLITGYVAERWWLMDRTIREELALKIINWWSVSLGIIIKVKTASGECYPMCTGNAAIRYAIFADNSIAVPGEYYWYQDGWHELINEPCFYLPAALGRITYSGGHAVAALQVGEDPTDFNSWMFFQYFNANIVPGDSQMPVPSIVSLTIPDEIYVYGWSGPAFVEWVL